MPIWLRDYVVYHGLDVSLLSNDSAIAFDQALFELVRQSAPFDPDLLEKIDELVVDDEPEEETVAPRPPLGRGKQSALQLPADIELEEALLFAADALSTYRIRLSRLYKDYHDDLRHVFCSVYVRLLAYYRRNRSNGFVETMFGEQMRMTYTMFANAVFFESKPHPPADVELDPIHWYQCRGGTWSCIRVYGTRGKSPLLAKIMREVDRRLRDALNYPHPLKEKAVPKYLASMIDREIEAWLTWKQAHAPRKVEIDLSQLAGIRSAAAVTREALLTDEERDQGTTVEAVEKTPTQDGTIRAEEKTQPPNWPSSEAELGDEAKRSAARNPEAKQPEHAGAPAPSTVLAAATAPAGNVPPRNESPSDSPLSPAQAAYLQALLTEDEDAKTKAVHHAGISEDMLVDAINEALFDLLGDTAIEFGSTGPQVIEDYEDDVRGVLA